MSEQGEIREEYMTAKFNRHEHSGAKSLTEEQCKRARNTMRERGETGSLGCLVCDNCGDNAGHLSETDAIRFIPPRLSKEYWCYTCTRSDLIVRRLRNILPKEHDYDR